MKKSYIVIGVIVVLALVLFFSGKSSYNSFVSLDQTVEQSWAQVENQYQRRLDLIPNLVNTVKGYAAHESSTLQGVTDARVGLKKAYDEANAALNSQEIGQVQTSQNNLMEKAGLYINAVHEAYPDLKANSNFLKLQDELAGTENRINTERTRYNEAVENFNKKILLFPGSLFAWGYAEKDMFKADAAASKAPVVNFGTEEAPSVDF